MTEGRDEGFAALSRGDDLAAATLLSEACRRNPTDFPAHLGLGQALVRIGRAQEAVAALEWAVSLAPPSSEARRELGIALAAAGRTPDAIRALQHALTLRPNDLIAQDALERLRLQVIPTSGIATPLHTAGTQQLPHDVTLLNGEPQAMPEAKPPVARRILLLDPDAELPEMPPYSPPIPTGHEPTLYMVPPPIGQPLAGQSVAEQPIPHYGFPAVTTEPMSGPPWAGPVEPAVMGRDDEFSVSDAYYDLIEILAGPRDFFAAQEGRNGNRAPLSMVLVYNLNIAIGLLALLFTQGAQLGPSGMILVLLSPIAFVLLYSLFTAAALVGAGVLHACCALFRGHAAYAGSFRAAIYAAAPLCTAIALALLLTPLTAHHGPLAAVHDAMPPALAAIGALWSAALLGIALRSIHRLSLWAIVTTLVLLTAICIGCGLAFNLLPTIG